MAEWPKPGKVDEKAIASMQIFNNIISEIRQYKAGNKMAQNAELEKIKINLPDKFLPEREQLKIHNEYFKQ